MFHPLFRRILTILLLTTLSLIGISYLHPNALPKASSFPQFSTSKLTSYLSSAHPNINPLAYINNSNQAQTPSSSSECHPNITITAYKTTKLRTTTAWTSIVTTTESFTTTSVQSVTETKTQKVVQTAACQCPAQNAFFGNPVSGADTTPIVDAHVPIGAAPSPEQETIAKMQQEGIVTIFKTGAQEVGQLAIQIGTTLRYLSERDILFFSDQASSLGPFLINDALRNVDQDLKLNHPDFSIYRDIQKFQSTGQDILQFTESNSKGDGQSAWVLDKYKFIHMVEETFEMRPNAKWYVFIDTDSYLFLDNLVEWLKRLDSQTPMYLGSLMTIGDTAFAHGGSGYVLSNAAMNKLIGPDQPQGLAASWDERMKGVCCGDLALGTALKEKGVHITVAHPLLNGYKPTTFTYGPNNHWCQPVVTMHHIVPHEVSATWRYERRREMLGISNATIFADLYFQFVEPHLTPSRDNWDNLSHGTEYSQQIQDEAALYRNKIKEAEKKEKTDEEAKKAEEDEKKRKEEVAQRIEKEKKKQRAKKKAQKKLKEQELALERARLKSAETMSGPPAKSVTVVLDGDDESDDETQSLDETEMEDINKAIAAQLAKLKLEIESKRKHVERQEDEPVDRTTEYTETQQHAHESFENCGKACEENPDCFQWVFYEKTCKLGASFRLGKYVAPKEDGEVVWKSGWNMERIRQWTDTNACQEPAWPDIR